MLINTIQLSEPVQQNYAEVKTNYFAASYALLSQLENTIAVAIDTSDSKLEEVLQKYSQNPSNWPPLHYAVECGDKNAVQVLLDNGHNFDERLPKYYTPGVYDDGVIGAGSWDDGMTPLEIAFERHDLGMLELLLKKGANPNSMRTTGYSTSLVYQAMDHYAAEFYRCPFVAERPRLKRFYLNVLKLLVVTGADLNQECFRNTAGSRTPLQEVEYWKWHRENYSWRNHSCKDRRKEYEDIVRELLIEGGAKV
jgi:hypothetical protein